MSKPYELHFNPKAKNKGFAFDTFCFKPKTKQERQFGNLYFACKINLPVLYPEANNFIAELADQIENEYYNSNYQDQEQALQAAANILKNHPQSQQLEWALFALQNNLTLLLSKSGKLFCLLYRENEVFDLASNLNGYLTNGSLKKNDLFIILTENVLDAFEQLKLLEKFCETKNKKQLNEVLKEYKTPLSGLFGFALLLFIKKPLPRIFFAKPKFFKRAGKPWQFVLRAVLYLAILFVILYLGYRLF